jgi:NADPH:quinone reductase-like Zn-dependent oxidoreductase
VHATAINPIDWKIRAGYLKGIRDYVLPLIPGWDFSGAVESVGPGVTQWKAGDEVYGRPDLGRSGTYAEYFVVRESEIAPKPKSLDHVHAAAIPLTGLTAWQALFDHGGLSAGQKVLIHAGAGGVGSFAIQFAKRKGAYVAATASGRNQSFLKELGADQPINYETTRFEDVTSAMDVVLDSLAGDVRKRSWKVLRKDGILVSILGPPPSEEDAKAHGVRTTLMWAQANPAQLAEIGRLVDEGRVKVHVETVFPLAEAAKAHELGETNRVRGKVVLRVV